MINELLDYIYNKPKLKVEVDEYLDDGYKEGVGTRREADCSEAEEYEEDGKEVGSLNLTLIFASLACLNISPHKSTKGKKPKF